jgi:hypothetical protein
MKNLVKFALILCSLVAWVGCPGQTTIGNGTVITGGLAVQSLNALGGPITLVGDSSVSITPSGQNIQFHATGAAIAHVTNILKGDGSGNAIAATGSTNGSGDYQLPVTVSCSGTGISCSLIGTAWTITLTGAAGTGAVATGGPRNLAGYGSTSSTTVQPLPQIATIDSTLSLSTVNSVVAAFNCGSCTGNTGTVIIPDGVGLSLPFFNQTVGFPSANPGTGISDLRTGTHLYQMTSAGLACDARQITVSLTSSSANFTVTSGTLTAADTGKLMPIGYTVGGYNGTQYAFYPTITFVSGTSGTLSTSSPFTTSSPVVAWLGTDNNVALNGNGTTSIGAMGALGASNLVGLWPSGCSALSSQPLKWNNSQNLIGQSGATSFLIGSPALDVVTTVDASGNNINAPGLVFGNMQLVPDTSVDITRPYTVKSANGTVTNPTPVYRPDKNNTSAANNPLAPAWCVGCNNYVANTTQNSAVICVPNALGRTPAVGSEVMIPYSTAIFKSTISSTAGSCSAGFTPFTMAAALPNTSGYTLTQTPIYTSSSTTGIQNLAVALTAGSLSYPVTITLANACAPVPIYDSNMAPQGRLKLGSEVYQYLGVGYSTAANTCTMALWNGPTSTTGWGVGTVVAPMNPCYAQATTPWPVYPTINSGDSTPSGARTFPGLCVGNAGLAFPQANGNTYVGTGLYRANVDNLVIATAFFSPVNFASTTAGVYIGGNNQPYATTFSRVRISGTAFGLAEGEAGYGQHGIAAVGPTGQMDHFIAWSATVAYPMTIMGNQDFTINGVDAYTTALNPFNNTTIGASYGLYMTYSTDEQNGNVVQSTGGGTITDWNAEPENGTHIVTPQYSDTNCSTCTWNNDSMEGAGQNIAGSNNAINGGQWSGNAANPVILYGNNNTFNGTISTATGKISNVWGIGTYLNWGAQNTGFTPSAYGGGPNLAAAPGLIEPTSGYDNDSFRDGLLMKPPVSNKEGYFGPYEFGPNIDPGSIEPSPFQVGYTIDPTAPYSGAWVGCNVTSSTGCAPFHIGGFFGYYYIGQDQRVRGLPYVNNTMVKTTGNQTFTYQVKAVDPGGANDTCPGAATLLNTTVTTVAGIWTPVTNNMTFSGREGCILQFVFNNSTSADTVQVAYEQFQPVPNTVLIPAGTLTGGAACTPSNSLQGSDNSNFYICDSAGIIKAVPYTASAGTTTICSATITLSGSLGTITQGVLGSGTCTGATTTDVAVCSTPTNAFTLSGFVPSSSGIVTVNSQVTANTITINGENNTASSQTVSGPTYTCKVFR